MSKAKCSINDCDRPVAGRRMCDMHYSRWRKAAAPGEVRERVMPPAGAICSIIGCGKPYRAKWLCETHYRRLLTHGDPLAAVRTKNGTGYINRQGYRVLYRPSHPEANRRGDVLEHRLAMAEILGRPLFADETVHHLNGDRSDNRPGNLELWSSSQPAGQRVEDKLAWAQEIIRRYGS